MDYSNVPHDDFKEELIAGYQLIRGINAGILGIPGSPGVSGNMTSFLLGIKAGIRAAGAGLRGVMDSP